MALMSNRNLAAKQDLQGYVMIGVCLLVLVGVGGAVVLTQPRARDVATGCELGVLPLHVLGIVDRTDPWSLADRAILRNGITQLADASPTGARLSLIAFDGGADVVPVPLFDKCRPMEGRAVNAAFSTPAKVDQVFAETFGIPLAATIDELTRVSNAPSTNLVQFISTNAALVPRAQSGRRVIRIWSDMCEHTPSGSFLGKRPFDPVSFTAYFRQLVGDRLKGIELEIVVTPSQSTPPAVARRIKAAWATALTASGVTYSWEQL